MIVCICRGISDRDVAEEIRRGACSLDELSQRCDGAGRDCGSCVPHLERHLHGGNVRHA